MEQENIIPRAKYTHTHTHAHARIEVIDCYFARDACRIMLWKIVEDSISRRSSVSQKTANIVHEKNERIYLRPVPQPQRNGMRLTNNENDTCTADCRV